MPKRKLAECTPDGACVGGESEDSSCSSVQTDGSTEVSTNSQGQFTHVRKKVKKSVSFEGVTVYYFPRKQGFTCVPSQGGSTLGMSEKHHNVEKFSLGEYAVLQRRTHHDILLDQHQQGKIVLPPDKLQILGASVDGSSNSSEVTSEDEDIINGADDDDDDFSIDDYYFLQPVPTRQRRVLLRQSGIKKIEALEKDECKDIRSSREVCGCNCKVFCDPDTCICSQAGIKCQVDRLSFPCGCSKDGCGNLHGRIEFNPIRVRTHFLHTLMRLELEKKGPPRYGVGTEIKAGGGILKSKRSAACQVKQNKRTASEGSSSQCLDPLKRDEPSPSDCRVVPTDNGNTVQSAMATSEPSKEELDLNLFNSNEKGSCRDCQKSDISELIMRESQFSAGAPSAELDSCMGASDRTFSLAEEHGQVGLPTVNNPGESLPQLMMFSDEDEETYNADNPSAMFQFPKEESSYSESSDCSSEGAGSVDEQPVYRNNYHNFPAPYEVQGPEGQQSRGSVLGTKSEVQRATANNRAMAMHAKQPGMCTYQQNLNNGPATAPSGQKYMNLNNSSNGYKLEPISEILNPVRFSGFPPGSVANPTANQQSWPEQQYCPYGKNTRSKGAMVNGQGNRDKPMEYYSQGGSNPGLAGMMDEGVSRANHSSQYLYPGCQSEGKQESNGLELCASVVTSASKASGLRYSQSASYSSPSDATMYNHRDTPPTNAETNKQSKAAATAPADKQEQDKPKYHELKSSSQPSAESSLASSYFSSAANQGPASFDLTNQNTTSTVPSYRNHSSNPQSCASEITSTSSDLFGLPRAQTAQPVATFDLPNANDEPSSEDRNDDNGETDQSNNRSSSPASEQVATTQNFGEIIKESIFETVSA